VKQDSRDRGVVLPSRCPASYGGHRRDHAGVKESLYSMTFILVVHRNDGERRRAVGPESAGDVYYWAAQASSHGAA